MLEKLVDPGGFEFQQTILGQEQFGVQGLVEWKMGGRSSAAHPNLDEQTGHPNQI